MNKYEIMVIVDAQKNQQEKDEVIKQTSDAITKGGGKVTSTAVWLDKHRMAFNIKKKNEGTYYLLGFDSAAASLTKIREFLRLNEEILRCVITKAV